MTLKIAWLGSITAALLASGCAVSGPSLLPGFWIMLDSPEESSEECAGDCPQANTAVAPEEKDKAATAEAEEEAPRAQNESAK
jgi:hypothetical protein